MSERPRIYCSLPTDQGVFIANRMDYCGTPESAYGVSHQLFTKGSYDPSEVELAIRMLRLKRQYNGNGVIALDCGANIGVHTIAWANELYPFGYVLAVEAQERIFYCLAGAISLNNCHNARAIFCAIGETNGQLEVDVPDYLVPGSFGSMSLIKGLSADVGKAANHTHRETIPMRSIDSFNLPRLDFLKLDVEGMEISAIRGALASIENQHPIMLIEHLKSDKRQLQELVEGLGYKVFEGGSNLLAVHSEDPALKHIT